MFAPHPRTSSRAFSLIELMMVMGMVVLLSTLAVSAFKGGTGNQLSAGVQKTIGILTMARTEAAVHRMPTRVAIAIDWDDNKKAEYRALSIWRSKEGAPTEWQQITNWEYLPEGVVFDPEGPVSLIDYGSKKIAYFFDSSLGNGDTPLGNNSPGQMKFVEFLPNGTVRTPESEVGEDFMVRLAEGYQSSDGIVKLRRDGEQDNYADIVTDSLVGRVKAYRP